MVCASGGSESADWGVSATGSGGCLLAAAPWDVVAQGVSRRLKASFPGRVCVGRIPRRRSGRRWEVFEGGKALAEELLRDTCGAWRRE